MGYVKGQLEFRKFEEGKRLTRKQAMLAQCYVCNGMEDSYADCKGYSCPMYQYHPYRGLRTLRSGKSAISNTKEKEA